MKQDLVQQHGSSLAATEIALGSRADVALFFPIENPRTVVPRRIQHESSGKDLHMSPVFQQAATEFRFDEPRSSPKGFGGGADPIASVQGERVGDLGCALEACRTKVFGIEPHVHQPLARARASGRWAPRAAFEGVGMRALTNGGL